MKPTLRSAVAKYSFPSCFQSSRVILEVLHTCGDAVLLDCSDVTIRLSLNLCDDYPALLVDVFVQAWRVFHTASWNLATSATPRPTSFRGEDEIVMHKSAFWGAPPPPPVRTSYKYGPFSECLVHGIYSGFHHCGCGIANCRVGLSSEEILHKSAVHFVEHLRPRPHFGVGPLDWLTEGCLIK